MREYFKKEWTNNGKMFRIKLLIVGCFLLLFVFDYLYSISDSYSIKEKADTFLDFVLGSSVLLTGFFIFYILFFTIIIFIKTFLDSFIDWKNPIKCLIKNIKFFTKL